VGVLLVAVWVLVAPWMAWPHLPPEVSRRLTLVVCWVGLGLWGCSRTGHAVGLPRTWMAVVVALLAVMGWHLLPMVREATYFERFIETAFLADGLIVLLAGVWGLWAARQLPLVWLRRLRWAGLVMVVANLVACAHGATMTGLLGRDKLLGAYALLWLPVLVAWRWWLAPLPLALLWACGSETMWVGVAVMAVYGWPRRAWWLVPLVVIVGLLHADWHVVGRGQDRTYSKVVQRLETWPAVVLATAAHPVAGWGYSPMAFHRMQAAHGPRLPSVHSDWLSVAFHAGWVVCALLCWVWVSILRAPPRSPWQRALQAGICGIGVLGLGQSLVSDPRIAGLLLLLLAWWWAERDNGQEVPCNDAVV